MKKQLLSFCTAGLLTLSLCPPVFAASMNTIRPNLPSTATSAVRFPTDYPPDAEGFISFQNLESRLRKQNLSVISLQSTLDIQKKFDRKATYDNLVETINAMVDLSWGMSQAGMDTQTMNANIEALRAQLEPLKEDNYQESLEALSHQIENSIQKIIQGAQSLYLNIMTYELSLADLNRNIATLDSNVHEMELRLSLGQISELTYQQWKTNQKNLQTQKASMELALQKMRASLAILLGESTTKEWKLTALPASWRNKEFSDQSYENALLEAKKQSFTVYSAEKSRKDAKKDWEDAQDKLASGTFSYRKAEQTYQTALSTYDTAIKNFEISFRALYQAVPNAEQALTAAEATLLYQQKLYEAAQLKYQQGQLSQKQLTAAENDLLAARSATSSAEIQTFTAIYQYRMAFIADAI